MSLTEQRIHITTRQVPHVWYSDPGYTFKKQHSATKSLGLYLDVTSPQKTYCSFPSDVVPLGDVGEVKLDDDITRVGDVIFVNDVTRIGDDAMFWLGDDLGDASAESLDWLPRNLIIWG